MFIKQGNNFHYPQSDQPAYRWGINLINCTEIKNGIWVPSERRSNGAVYMVPESNPFFNIDRLIRANDEMYPNHVIHRTREIQQLAIDNFKP